MRERKKMAIQPIKISDFRAIHGLSNRTFSRMRKMVQLKHPDVQVTEMYYLRIYNNNVVHRPDLFEEFLPLVSPRKKPPSSKLDVQNLYFRIEELEKEAARQKEELTARATEQSEILVGKA